MPANIPKIIHFCWFGNAELPPLAKKCIASWKKYCPDYKIYKWSENNFDLNCCAYVREAYKSKKWAFVSDVARLMIVYKYGGVYLDTDVELLASLDRILNGNEFFFGIETDTYKEHGVQLSYVATGLGFGATAGNPVVKAMLDEYRELHFKMADGFDTTPCPIINSRALEVFGYKNDNRKYRFKNGTIYPCDYFCPKEFDSPITHFTKNTVSIHHYGNSWNDPEKSCLHRLQIDFERHLPKKISYQLAAYCSAVKYNGLFKGTAKRFKALLNKLQQKQ